MSKVTVTNNGHRARAFKVRGGFATVAPGKTETLEPIFGVADHPELDITREAAAPDLPALTGKNKDQLLAIAADEGVEVADGATNAQIVEAIEAKRNG